MTVVRWVLMALALVALTACSTKFRTYTGPQVTSVQVQKAAHKMYLLHGTQVLAAFDIGLGAVPVGDKQVEGDGRTPEGTYYITHQNPRSKYHLSLGISYPNNADRAVAAFLAQPTGGDIFIHGGPNTAVSSRDWTAGCIAVTDSDMEWIYAMVKPGTRIDILP